MLALSGSFLLSQSETGKIAHGVYIGELSVANLSRDAARAKANAWIEARANASITCTLEGAALEFVPKNAGLHGDDSAVDRALAVGRQGSILGRFAGFIARWFRPVVIPITASFEASKLEPMLAAWEREKIKDHPFVGGISVSGTIVTPLYAHAGSVIDRERAPAQLKAIALSGRGAAIATRLERPNEDRAEVDHLVTLAASMLTSEIELSAPDGTQLSLGAVEIAPLLQVKAETEHGKLSLFCSPEATEKLLAPRRAQLERAPQNAKFVIDAEDHVNVEPGRAGLTLDDRDVANAICAAAQDPTKKAALPLRPGAEPALSTQQAEALGIKGLMGTYTTRHACCQPRVENIHHIADLLDGTVVKPGDTFSVNQTIGPRTVKNGFRPAPSIEDGDMVDTVGGGVSQFATTLFNALFYGGYDIIERQPHTYWFTRYPMGYDATLSFPHPDIIFKNDTDAGALIKTSYTDKSITVKIYGDNGGRKVRAEVSPRENIVQPPLEYIPNRHLDADEEKARESGEIG
ncbi:MAG TPA: VanW family protein, partial [Polyangiaceae bacterium]|nr:VanW family protein [Polyangiaceae bacterium]